MRDDSLNQITEQTDGPPPSEAWLFAQAIMGNPIPRIVSPEAAARAKRDELQRLAQLSAPRRRFGSRRMYCTDREFAEIVIVRWQIP
jgi:hypothetical protein